MPQRRSCSGSDVPRSTSVSARAVLRCVASCAHWSSRALRKHRHHVASQPATGSASSLSLSSSSSSSPMMTPDAFGHASAFSFSNFQYVTVMILSLITANQITTGRFNYTLVFHYFGCCSISGSLPLLLFLPVSCLCLRLIIAVFPWLFSPVSVSPPLSLLKINKISYATICLPICLCLSLLLLPKYSRFGRKLVPRLACFA